MKNRWRDINIFNCILRKFKGRKLSIRKIAKDTGIPKSSVHRRITAMIRRVIYPESHFWESEEGVLWLKRFILVLIIQLMIRREVGAPTISQLLNLLHLQNHIATSPDTLEKMCKEVEGIIVEYGQQQKEQNKEVGVEKVLELILGNDELFFNNHPLLLSMELRSGFIFLEKKCEDRTYDTWLEELKKVLPAGSKVISTVSDKAAALLKLASDGLGVLAIADLFHAIWGISKKLGAAFGRLKTKAAKSLAVIELAVTISTKTPQRIDLEQNREALIQQQSDYELITQAQKKYQEEMRGVVLQVHPFKISGGTQSSESAEEEIRNRLAVLTALSEEWKIAGGKEAILKFECQTHSICSIIDMWWTLFRAKLKELYLSLQEEDWLINVLLPAVYWKVQLLKTDSKKIANSYREALRIALENLQEHPFTGQVGKKYKELENWCRKMVEYFQRTSSAVEGRNGQLSQSYHCGRGLSSQRVKVLTILHNYDHQGVYGVTPAEHLFGRAPPNLFEYILRRFERLPKPKNRKIQTKENFLDIKLCPALSV